MVTIQMRRRAGGFSHSIGVLVVSIGLVAVLSGCAGKSVKFEINPADNNVRQMQDLAQAHQADVPEKALPPMSSDDLEAVGDGWLTQGKPAMAYMQYEKALKSNPGNVRIEYKKGLAFLAAGKNDDAVSQFNLVIKKDSKFDLAYEGLGRAYFQKKDYGNAENNFRKAVELNHKLWMSYNYLGNIYDFKRDYEQAILEYSSAISVKGDEGLLYNNLGVSNLLAGHYQAALDAFNKAKEKYYRERRVNNNMALALAGLGRYDEAFDAFKSGGGEAHAYNNMGCIYMEKKKYREAVGCFEKAIALEPGYYAKAGENLKKARLALGEQQ